MQALQAWLRGELAVFPTSLEEDGALLQQMDAGPKCGLSEAVLHAAEERLRLALQYRIERKLLLLAGLEVLGHC